MQTARQTIALERGFTLIEIMVVVMIIGLAVSMVNLTVRGDSPAEQLENEAQEFMLEANYVAEQAVLKGETYGLFVEVRPLTSATAASTREWCYQWRRVRDQQWDDLPELPEQRCLPEAMEMDIVVDGKAWKYDPELEYQDPVLGFFPSGDASGDVEVAIYREDQGLAPSEAQTQRIKINLMGERHWLNQEALAAQDQQAR